MLFAVLAALALIGIGQLYQRGIRLEASGTMQPLAESINQLAIFSPMLALLVIRRHALATAWIRVDKIPARIGVGLGLACVAVVVFTSAHPDAEGALSVLPRVFAWRHADEAVQVLLEDVAIAILVVRFAVATRPWIAVVLVAALFAAGHVPAMLAEDASAAEIAGLARDFALGIGIIAVALRSADVWWLACVHFAMDMMQYESGAKL